MNFSELKNEDGTEKLLLSIGAMTAGFLLKEALKSGYKKVYHEDPPSETAEEDVNWKKLLIWTVASGITVSLMQVLLKRYSHIALTHKK